MRAKTTVHVEYEIFQHILDTIDLSSVEQHLVPPDDDIAQKRFDRGAKQAAQFIQNLVDRRTHRLPKSHTDYEGKE